MSALPERVSPADLQQLARKAARQGRGEEAISALRKAVALRPGSVELLNDLGNALLNQRKFGDAIQSYERALGICPDYAQAHINLGNAYLILDQHDRAVDCYRRALAAEPGNAVALNNMGSALQGRGEAGEAIACYRQAIGIDPSYERAHSRLLTALHFHDDYSPRALREEHLAWARQHVPPSQPPPLPSRAVAGEGVKASDPDRRLRVGYVSPNFREHCQSLFTLPLFANHDRERFEIYCYAGFQIFDETTQRLRGLVDGWRDTGQMDDAAVAELVREDGIDILVDLTMHMRNGRPLRPAPIAVAWLAYPGTTGLGAVDYRLTDPHLDPPGEQDDHYVEKSWRLPESFWCYDPGTDEPVNELPALSAGCVTFGCLNNFCKVSDRTLALWGAVLAAVPKSRLVLLAPEGVARQRVLGKLVERGIEAGRIGFVGRQPRGAYLRTYHQIDVGLDTVPYNGHTTSLDCYFMGIPVVTLVGQTVVGRAGLSQLTNLGLGELVGRSEGEFVRIAVDLANDLPRLVRLRGTLRERMRGSALMDGARFARGVEAAYRKMWRDWCANGRDREDNVRNDGGDGA
jgi:predicted O-linked N-acetylglucosamine transferase (SPINDLY family)